MRYLPLILIATLAGCGDDCAQRCQAIGDLYLDCEEHWDDIGYDMVCYDEGNYDDDMRLKQNQNVEPYPCEDRADVVADCNRLQYHWDEEQHLATCYATTPRRADTEAECVAMLSFVWEMVE